MASDKQKYPVHRKPKSCISAPFLWIDWVCQWIAYLAGNLAVFRVLEYAGKVTVLVALIGWIVDYPQREQAAVRTAWSVVNAKGGGRKEALEYLASHQVDLKGLYGTGGYFEGIVLNDRDLRWSELADANFENADLTGANLQDSKLPGVNFKNANLVNANFGGALITDSPLTNFEGAQIDGADFRRARIQYSSSGFCAPPRVISSFTAAHDWQNAKFDDSIRHAIECAANPEQCSCQ
jgi:hypothetical protein